MTNRSNADEKKGESGEGSGVEKKAPKSWHDHVARSTAVLAVLAAVSSGQYAGQFSRTILAQAEASDQWAFYQSKSIKKHLTQNQADMARALAAGRPDVKEILGDLLTKTDDAAKKYDAELAQIKTNAEKIEEEKRKHEAQGYRFQLAFVILQAGVVLATIAASSKRRELWIAALIAGVLGVIIVGDGFLLVTHKLNVPVSFVEPG